MGVQLIDDENPFPIGIGINGPRGVTDEIFLSPCWSNGRGNDLSCGYLKVNNRSERAVPDVLELSAFDEPGARWLGGVLAFQGLNPRLFVGTDDSNTLLMQFIPSAITLMPRYTPLFPFLWQLEPQPSERWGLGKANN